MEDFMQAIGARYARASEYVPTAGKTRTQIFDSMVKEMGFALQKIDFLQERVLTLEAETEDLRRRMDYMDRCMELLFIEQGKGLK